MNCLFGVNSSELLYFMMNWSTLWKKYTTAEYVDGFGQQKDGKRRKMVLNHVFIWCSCTCILLGLISLAILLSANEELNFWIIFTCVYIACISAALSILCIGAMMLTFRRIWDTIGHSKKPLQNDVEQVATELYYNDSKCSEMTMFEFSQKLAEKLVQLQRIRKNV